MRWKNLFGGILDGSKMMVGDTDKHRRFDHRSRIFVPVFQALDWSISGSNEVRQAKLREDQAVRSTPRGRVTQNSRTVHIGSTHPSREDGGGGDVRRRPRPSNEGDHPFFFRRRLIWRRASLLFSLAPSSRPILRTIVLNSFTAPTLEDLAILK